MGERDLDGFSAMAVDALTIYPDAVLVALADARKGIVSKCKFMPTIAEMRDWCSTEAARQFEELAYEARLRLPAPEPEPPEDIERRRALVERLKPLINRLDHGQPSQSGARLETDDELIARMRSMPLAQLSAEALRRGPR